MLIALLSTTCLILVVLSILQQLKLRALRQGEEVFRTLAENSSDLIMRYDQDCRRLYVNPVVARLFGRSVEEIIGQSLVDSAFLDSEQNRKVFDGIRRVFETGETVGVEVVFTDEEGRSIDYSILLIPERDTEGKVKTVLGLSRDTTKRNRAEQDLKQALEFTEGIINAIPDLLFELDLNGKYLNVWAQNPTLLAAQKELLLGNTVHDVLLPDAADIAMSAIEEADRKGSSFGKVIRIVLPQGECWFELSVSRKPGPSQTDRRFIGLSHDITERKRMELQLAAHERELRTLLEHIPDNIARYTPDARHMYISPVTVTTNNKPKEYFLGKTPMECFPDGRYSEYEQRVLSTAASGGCDEMEMAVPMADGETQTHFIRFIAEHDEKGKVVSVLVIGTDITPLKMHEQQLERIAHHDPLTGLPNRLLFMDRLNQAVAQTRRAGGLLAVCFADLDGFKPVNDQYGHAAGDLVLAKVADRMKESVRDIDTVGRIGGDEFVVVLLNLENAQECEVILRRLLHAVAQPIRLDGHSLSVTASLGVALFPQDDSDPDTLLRHADMAMYQAKQGGKNTYRFFEPDRP